MRLAAPDSKSFLPFLDDRLGLECSVPGVRFELTRPYGQRVLSPPRLPFRHPGARGCR